MKREKNLVKNMIIIAIGQTCTKFISFFLLPLYTALLSTEEYGIVDLLNSYISLFLPIVYLQIDQAIFRFLIDIRNDDEKKKNLITTSFVFMIFQSIIYLIIFIFFSRFINNNYKYFLATNVVVAIFANLLLQISRGLGDNTTYSLGSLISGSGTIVFNVVFIVIFKLGAYGMLLASVISNFLCGFFILFKLKIYKYFALKKISIEKLKALLKYSIPLVPNSLSWWIINVSDRTIITFFLGVAFNGIYSAANKFSNICITFFSIFNLTWTESASIHFKDSDSLEYFSNVINVSLKFFISVCFGIISIMPFVFKILIRGTGYSLAYYQIPILMISTIFNICVTLLGSIYIAQKRSKEIAKTSIYSAIINIVINIFLVKYMGLYAASLSTLLAYFLMTIYRYIDLKKYIKIDLEILYFSIPFGLIIIFSYYLKNIYLSIIILILEIIFTLIINKNLVLKLIELCKRKFNQLKNFNTN